MKQLLIDQPNGSSFGLSVENAIVLLLPHGKAHASEIARKLGVSRRTLARRLASEGVTFAGIVQSLKSDLARRHLTDETLSISEIAWLLGYQDVSAFSHAFKRWTGNAPTALREPSRRPPCERLLMVLSVIDKRIPTRLRPRMRTSFWHG